MKDKPFIYLLKTPLNYYVFDVNTKQVIMVSDTLYEYLKNPEKSPFAEKENLEIIREIKFLKSKGYMSSKRPKEIKHGYSDLLQYELDYSIQQITLQVTQECNFRCSYCPYTADNFSTQRGHAQRRMTLETACKAVDFFAEHSVMQDNVAIGFYGGEPLLEFGLIKKVTEYAQEVLSGKDIVFTITTNGTVLTDEIINFLYDNEFGLIISLDGTPETHNKSRKFAKTGEGTFSAIERNLDRISIMYPAFFKRISFNCVVDPRNSCDSIHLKFSQDGAFKHANIMSTLIDDFFYIEKVVGTEEYIIESGRHWFKAYCNRRAQMSLNSRTEMSLSRRKGCPETGGAKSGRVRARPIKGKNAGKF